MEGARLITDKYRLELRSRNWVEHGDVFCWSSTGPPKQAPFRELGEGHLDSIEANWAAGA